MRPLCESRPIITEKTERTVDMAVGRHTGGGDLVREETCLEKFRTPNSGAILPILFFGHQVQNLYPVLRGGGGGGMIGGGGCRIKYVMWMAGLVRFCVSGWAQSVIWMPFVVRGTVWT